MWGPLRSTWCMLFEHMNQVVKHSALRNNFLNTLDTTATRLAEALAFNLYSERHVDFLKPVMFVQHEEMCGSGSSPIIDMLIGSNRVCLSEESQSIKVQWLWKVKVGNTSYQVGDSVLCSSADTRHVAQIVSLLHISDKLFLQMQLVVDAPRDQVLPSVTWNALRATALAPLEQSAFAELSSISLALLHPVGRSGDTDEVHFLSW